MLRVVRPALDHRLEVETREAPLDLVPEEIQTYGLGGERTPTRFAFEQEPLIGSARSRIRRDVPDSIHVLPENRLALPNGMLARDLVFGDHEVKSVEGGAVPGERGLEDCDEKTETEETRHHPSSSIPVRDHPDADPHEEDRDDEGEP